MMSNKEARATLYVVGNINVDVIMGTLDSWPQRGTEVMLQHSELRPGGSAGNCALALEAMQVRHRAVLIRVMTASAHGWRAIFRTARRTGHATPAKPRSPLASRTPITSDRSSAISVTLCGSARRTC